MLVVVHPRSHPAQVPSTFQTQLQSAKNSHIYIVIYLDSYAPVLPILQQWHKVIIHINVLIAIECPFGFEKFKGRCYKYFVEKRYRKTWSNAQTECKANNQLTLSFDLVSVHDGDENQFITQLMLRGDPDVGLAHFNYPWIGLHKDNQDSWSSAKWTDGTSYSYNNWGSGEPSRSDVRKP